MKVKSRYKRFKDGGAVLPEEIVAPDISLAATPEAGSTDVLGRSQDIQPENAAATLEGQLSALANAEALSRQRQQPQPIDSREARLQQWRQQGLTEAQAAFLLANPACIDRPELTAYATAQADRDGFGPDNPEHFEIVKRNFNRAAEQIERDLMTTSQQRATSVAEPEFFGPKPPPSPSVGYSAPVTRDAPTGDYRSERRSQRITLTPAEREIARLSGITELEYAQGKLELMRRKETGEIG